MPKEWRRSGSIDGSMDGQVVAQCDDSTPPNGRPECRASADSARSHPLELARDRRKVGRSGAAGRGPDGEEAVVADLLEGAQVFFPVEGPGREAGATRVGCDDTRGRRGVVGVSVGDPLAQRADGQNGVVAGLEEAGRVDAGREGRYGQRGQEARMLSPGSVPVSIARRTPRYSARRPRSRTADLKISRRGASSSGGTGPTRARTTVVPRSKAIANADLGALQALVELVGRVERPCAWAARSRPATARRSEGCAGARVDPVSPRRCGARSPIASTTTPRAPSRAAWWIWSRTGAVGVESEAQGVADHPGLPATRRSFRDRVGDCRMPGWTDGNRPSHKYPVSATVPEFRDSGAALEDRRHALALADADRRQAELRALVEHPVEQRRGEPCPGGAQRVADRDRAAAGVDPLLVDARAA